ncbi:hypothetical protein STEG23_004700, partial [Scotinomys teguina]
MQQGSFCTSHAFYGRLQGLCIGMTVCPPQKGEKLGLTRSRCRTLSSFSSTMSACTPLCPTMMIMDQTSETDAKLVEFDGGQDAWRRGERGSEAFQIYGGSNCMGDDGIHQQACL